MTASPERSTTRRFRLVERPQILVVEKETDIRELILEMLQGQGRALN